MPNYLETQNKLIATAQSLYEEKDHVDAVTYNGKEFIVFVNTHASVRPQMTNYISPGAKGFDILKEIIV